MYVYIYIYNTYICFPVFHRRSAIGEVPRVTCRAAAEARVQRLTCGGHLSGGRSGMFPEVVCPDLPHSNLSLILCSMGDIPQDKGKASPPHQKDKLAKPPSVSTPTLLRENGNHVGRNRVGKHDN